MNIEERSPFKTTSYNLLTNIQVNSSKIFKNDTITDGGVAPPTLLLNYMNDQKFSSSLEPFWPPL